MAAAAFGIAVWNALKWPRGVPASRGARPPKGKVSVLIPARDEEARLPACLTSLSAQNAQEILIYDDHSTDGTAAVIRSFAAHDPRVRQTPTAPLPPGWTGKTFACSQLAQGASNPEWLLFLDADARLFPGAVDAIAREAERRNVSLLSCWPSLETRGFLESILMPMLNFLVFSSWPGPLAEFLGHTSLGLAHGACILVHRDTYNRLGGHALVRNEIFEDTKLAREWRSRGERSLCIDGQRLVRLRMYSGASEIWLGFRKNFYPAFGHPLAFWAFLIFHGAVFLAPFFYRDRRTIGFILGARMALALRFGQPWWTPAFHPFAEAFLLALGASSWWKCHTGEGVVWKGRVLAAAASA
jgi:glycosyltransferase involved in cell wall biosynthesis